MIKTYRGKKTEKCWEDRYGGFPLDPHKVNVDMYPLKYVYDIISKRKGAKMLEVGCGLGRILKHFRSEGLDVYGMEYIFVPLERLNKETGFAKLFQADVRWMPIKDNSFDILTAFGVFHCLEKDIDIALKECYRILKPGGVLCASVQHQNEFIPQIFTTLISFFCHPRATIIRVMNSGKVPKDAFFYKWQFKKHEWEDMLKKANFKVLSTKPGYKKKLFSNLPFFSKKTAQSVNLQATEPQFTAMGEFLYSLLRTLFPWGSARWIVCIAVKE